MQTTMRSLAAVNKMAEKNVDVLRITIEEDFSWKPVASGLKLALAALMKATTGSKRKHVTVWFALPCTWGSTARVSNSVQGPPGEYTSRSAELWDDLEGVLPHLILLIHEVLLRKGDVVFEWPTNNYGYGLDLITQIFRRYALITLDVSGCKLGLVDSKGVPLQKHWTLTTFWGPGAQKNATPIAFGGPGEPNM